jgi:hypothetical protein
MIEFKNKAFDSLFDRGDALTLQSMRFEGCSFSNCALALTKSIERRSEVRDIELVNCSAVDCDIGPAVLRDVRVDGLLTNDLLIVWGAVFSHVTLSGQIGKLKINHWVHHVDRSPEVQGPFDAYREEFYRATDWALDISGARFKEFEVRGVPARLVRIDPETQAIVTRERALSPGWRERLSPSNTLWPFMIKLFLSDGDPDMVLAVPLGAAKSKRDALLKDLRELRTLGVAEPA